MFFVLQGIVHRFWTGRHQPLRIDTPPPNQNLPISMEVRLKANYFHPLKEETKKMSADSIGGCKIDPNKILKKRKEENCTDNCIPMIFSSLFDMSKFKECSDYDSHFCALEDLFLYVYERFECIKSGVEKYFGGTLDVINTFYLTDSYISFTLKLESWNFFYSSMLTVN